ncbi:sulfite dehydrogenase [Nitratifractor salsuginis]|uniref:Sulfur dehydrogenase subunit SoxC n=1 Tax=Nitratifractor salsuginis (strain DSM 16511 / JCM 12458 / E9I37-1) TaxID=749222 RepID=E6WZX3_NITSE|nr:sulfite dehydrogenase [Nitratifractor salsuginis]ADV45631.1 sulfur dehydrogenase subunit SoxC [Nitratifractor salsuginis DSM 16511]
MKHEKDRMVHSPTTAEMIQEVAKQLEELPKEERRDFLKRGVAFSVGAAAAMAGAGASQLSAEECKVDPENLPPHIQKWGKAWGRDVNAYPYGMPSKYESNVVRRIVPWLTADQKASVSFTPWQDLEGTIVPNGLHFVRCHGGVVDINPKEWRLMIHGLVERPVILTLEDLKRYPSVTRKHFFSCPANSAMEARGPGLNSLQVTHGMLSSSEYTGVLIKTILEDIGLKPEAKWMFSEGSDPASVGRSVPIEKVLDDAMLVYAMNGEALRPENGYPVRLLLPGWEGVIQTKWLRRLKFDDKAWWVREETTKYTELLPDGHAKMFNWVFESDSVITSPCPERGWEGRKPGPTKVAGIAWSGKGKITNVDVTLDGGKTWHEAKITSEVLPKMITRFEFYFDWDGKPLIIGSRSTDETGYTQPEQQQLMDARGTEFVYHRNAIQYWEVKANGEVNNVQIRRA